MIFGVRAYFGTLPRRFLLSAKGAMLLPAWGNAPGFMEEETSALKAAIQFWRMQIGIPAELICAFSAYHRGD